MSSFGLSEPWQSLRETPLTHSFCKYAVARRAPLVIPDTTRDPEFRDNPASRELAVVEESADAAPRSGADDEHATRTVELDGLHARVALTRDQ